MKNKLSILLFWVLTVLVVACADSSDTNGTAESGEEKDLTVGLVSDPVSLDPHAANDGNSLYVMNAMYDTLVELNTDLEIQPALAESLEPIEDTVWEAKLREDVFFTTEVNSTQKL